MDLIVGGCLVYLRPEDIFMPLVESILKFGTVKQQSCEIEL